jgi:DNA-binding XRE family transcriptional regulator
VTQELKGSSDRAIMSLCIKENRQKNDYQTSIQTARSILRIVLKRTSSVFRLQN